jgi:hypothetical protein
VTRAFIGAAVALAIVGGCTEAVPAADLAFEDMQVANSTTMPSHRGRAEDRGRGGYDGGRARA